MADHSGIPADILALARAARQRDPVALTALADRLTETGDAATTRHVLAFMAALCPPSRLDAEPLRKFLRERKARPVVCNGIPYRLARRLIPQGTPDRSGEATRRSRFITVGDLLAVTRRELMEMAPFSWSMINELTTILDDAGLHLTGDPDPRQPD